MSGVGGVSNVGSPANGYQVEGGTISPDCVMTYCAAQLNFLDEGIQQRMAQQQKSRDVQAALSDLKAALNTKALGANDWSTKQKIVEKFEAAFAKMAPNDPMRDRLNDQFHNFVSTAFCANDGGQANHYNLGHITAENKGTFEWACNQNNSDNAADLGEIKTMSESLDGLLTDCGKGAELQMISLQSMVSQRQMAVQLTTQIIAKLHETKQAIVAQIGKG